MDFRESVRVIWPGEASGVVARAVNLSAAGILVDAPTPTPCPVGSDVLCDVSLPRGQRLLRGRVAHRRLLSPAKIGMGIEFVDLSPRETAELRDVVVESEERPQRVKVRFEGTDQIVSARAHATPHGFRLATALPFLKSGTGVDISMSPEAGVSARGWVASVGLDRTHPDGAPRLVIDVRVDEDESWDAATPVVDVQPQAVPELVWEPEALGATPVSAGAELDGPVGLEDSEEVPTIVSAGVPLPAIVEPSDALGSEHDRTEVIPIPMDRPRGRWAALRAGMLAGVIAFGTFAIIFVATRTAPPRREPPPSLAPPVIVTQPVAPAPAAVAPVAEPPVAAPAEPPAAAPVEEPAEFALDLVGSTSGAHRYVLRNPDGVAYNLPHARPTLPLGTHRPKVPGLRAVWLRPLPGGGTNARFFYAGDAAPPRVELDAGLIRVTAADK